MIGCTLKDRVMAYKTIFPISLEPIDNFDLQYVNNSDKALNRYFINISMDLLYVIQQQ